MRSNRNATVTSHQPARAQTASNDASRRPSRDSSSRPSSEAERRPLATWTRTQAITERKPPADLVLSLSSLFFRHIHPWLPFLDPRRIFGETACLDEPSLLCYALFGMSLPFSFDSRLDRNSSDAFWKHSKRRIFVETMEEPSYMSLEALTILTLDLSGITNGPQVWGALAVINKLAVQLRDVSGRSLRTSIEDSSDGNIHEPHHVSRWRLFWAIYTLDCYITMTTGHPSELSDCHIHHFLPTQALAWQDRPSTSAVDPGRTPSQSSTSSSHIVLTPTAIFNYQLDLLSISRRIHAVYVDYRCLPFEDESSLSNWLQRWSSCARELSTWYQGLPSFLGLVEPNHSRALQRGLPSLVMLHSYYHGLSIHLNSLVAFTSWPSSYQPSEFRQQSRATCLQSIASLTEMCSSFMAKIHDKLGWPCSWANWVAARYIILSRYHDAEDSRSQQLSILSQCLEEMGKYWQISRKYWRLLCWAEEELNDRDASPCSWTRPRILNWMVDLRTATCELEDQYRTDPMLHTEQVMVNSGQQQPSGVPQSFMDGNAIDPYLANSNYGSSGTFVFNESEFALNGSTADTWFTTPLFASSAFQQVPAVAINEGVEYVQ